MPVFCNTTVYINDYTGFQIVLPTNASQYAGTFTSQGCGGSCGTYQIFVDHPIFATDEKPDYKCTTVTNMRHDNADYKAYDYDNTTSGTCFTGSDGSSETANVGSWTLFKTNFTKQINFGYFPRT